MLDQTFVLQLYVQHSILPMVNLKPIHLKYILLRTLKLKLSVMKDMDQFKVICSSSGDWKPVTPGCESKFRLMADHTQKFKSCIIFMKGSMCIIHTFSIIQYNNNNVRGVCFGPEC